MANDPVETFINLYNRLDKNTLALLDDLYDDTMHFQDPLREIDGLTAFRDYLSHMYNRVTECRFDIVQIDRGDDWAWISWRMFCVHSQLNRGQPFTLDGCSRLTFNEKILTQRDYYDLGAMVYEHIPFIGPVIRSLKKRAGA